MLNILITFIIGILMFIGGAVSKKKWLMTISIIPLAIALAQFLKLSMM